MNFYLELLGYIASILVAISLMMSSLLKLRLINLVGAFFFVVYGLLIGAIPVAVVNGIIILVNLYFLYQMYSSQERFSLLNVNSDSDYLRYFLEFHEADIKTFVPDYRFEPQDSQLIIFVLRDLVPAGLFIGEKGEDGEFTIYLDYAIPAYRDFKIGRFLYQNRSFFAQHGIRQLKTTPYNATHEKYLQRVGFQIDNSVIEKNRYFLTVA